MQKKVDHFFKKLFFKNKGCSSKKVYEKKICFEEICKKNTFFSILNIKEFFLLTEYNFKTLFFFFGETLLSKIEKRNKGLKRGNEKKQRISVIHIEKERVFSRVLLCHFAASFLSFHSCFKAGVEGQSAKTTKNFLPSRVKKNQVGKLKNMKRNT
jgi:hypothetical protein